MDLPRLEPLHDGVLVLERQPAVQEPDDQVGKHLGLQRARHVGGRLEVDELRFLDERVHDVDLPAGRRRAPLVLLLRDAGGRAAAG